MTNEIKSTVKHLLETEPSLRDSDERLVANMWYYGVGKEIFTLADFLDAYSKGKITTADTITRARRHLQQLHPELRGTTWEVRQKKAGETREKFRELI